MKSNILILITVTISSLLMFGCDQIVDKSFEKIKKIKNNESTLINQKSSQKSLDSSSKENNTKKSENKESIEEEGLSNSNNRATKRKYDVIGTNKDGPYRSGENKHIRSGK